VLFLCQSSNGQWGSAVCTYQLDNVNKVFDNGPWIEQSKLESAWLRVADEDVPRPRPGQVCVCVCVCVLLASLLLNPIYYFTVIIIIYNLF